MGFVFQFRICVFDDIHSCPFYAIASVVDNKDRILEFLSVSFKFYSGSLNVIVIGEEIFVKSGKWFSIFEGCWIL